MPEGGGTGVGASDRRGTEPAGRFRRSGTRQPTRERTGLKPVGPTNATALPAAEKPAEAPDQVNDIKPRNGAGSSAGDRRQED